MSKLGAGITLLVIGAILTFAVDVRIPGVGKDALGVILMLGGVLAIVLWMVTENQRRHHHTIVERDAVVEEPVAYVDEGVRPVTERRRRRFL